MGTVDAVLQAVTLALQLLADQAKKEAELRKQAAQVTKDLPPPPKG